MINEISGIGICSILFLPFILKNIFRLSDYFGYIMGIRYLIISSIVQAIFTSLVPGSAIYKKNVNLELEKVLIIPIKERFITWIIELINSILVFIVLYYCISKLAKPTQNYNSIFLFVTGILIMYIIPFALYLILPLLSKNQKFKEAIEKQKLDEKYLSGEFLQKSIKRTIALLMNDTGNCLIILLYCKKLVGRGICYLNYLLPKLIKGLIICCGFEFIDKFSNVFYLCPFVLGIFYFCKFVGNGKLTNKYKDDSESD